MNKFIDIWINLDKAEKEQMAAAVESSVNYLSQVAHGHKTPSKQFAKILALHIDGGSSRETLFPGVFKQGAAGPGAGLSGVGTGVAVSANS